MDKKKTVFFRRTFCIMILICIVVFLWLTLFMSYKTQESISEISRIYMDEMNIQLRQKFSSLISLRLQQVDGIIMRTPPTDSYDEDVTDELCISAEVRNFTNLGFLDADGNYEQVYGNNLTLNGTEHVKATLERSDSLVLRGSDEADERILVLGKSARYPMKSGKTSVALLIGIPMEYLNEAMFLSSDDGMVYSHIIDENGSFVIRNAGEFAQSYFERLEGVVDDVKGKDGSKYAQELRMAMQEGKNYSARLFVSGVENYLFCSPISENTDWYIITIMPSGVIDESITRLDTIRITIMISSALVILVTLSTIFVLYYRISQQQMRDLDTARHEAERANMAKSAFLSSMSHDIRTPMNAIIGMTEIALRNIKDSVRVEDCLGKIRLSSKHLLGLINDVLDMSKIESGKMTLNIVPISLRDAMDDIVSIMKQQVKEHSQNFDIFIQDIVSERVCCDGVRLNQVLLNLLSNAVKFTPKNGRINVYVYQEESPKGEDYVRTHLRVTDTGIGMSEEFQQKIWDTFSREETEQVAHITGTGLGMAITKKIVEMMGGSIELKSKKDEGSDFHITIDMKRAGEEEEQKLPPWNILVVDDNEMLCYSAVANLEELGVHAEATTDGMEAVRMIEKNFGTGNGYHFVLVDWKMPGMDGMQTINEIRNRVGRGLPVFLISAYDWSDIEEEASLSIEGFIAKPLFKSTLYESLKQYVEGVDQKSEQAEKQEVDFTGKRILLAEDMDINWEVASAILSVSGLVLERAENGKICLDMFSESEPGYYDAILMDIRMPVMNGYDATVAIRALDRPDSGLPIIAMTADAFSDDAQHCLECGMNAHIPKPIDVKECMRVLQECLK